MGASLIVAVRQALVAAVNNLPAFAGVPVTFTYKPTDSREFAYTRNATFEHGPASMKAGRVFRNEEATFELAIWVESVGGSPEDAAERALELGLAVEEYVADNKNGIGGARTLLINGVGSLAEQGSDSSSFAELIYPIFFEARLT